MSACLVLIAPASADSLMLKSGERAELVERRLMQAPAVLGGPKAGNILELDYSVSDLRAGMIERDAASLCRQRHRAETEYLRSGLDIPESLRGTLDPSAPVVGLKIGFLPEGAAADGVSLKFSFLFDLRGNVPCRPIQ